jgi:hypothetical protein
MRCMSRSAILLKVGLVNFVFFQLRNDGIHNIATVSLGVESLRERNGGQGDTRLTLTPSVILNSNYDIMVSD